MGVGSRIVCKDYRVLVLDVLGFFGEERVLNLRIYFLCKFGLFLICYVILFFLGFSLFICEGKEVKLG